MSVVDATRRGAVCVTHISLEREPSILRSKESGKLNGDELKLFFKHCASFFILLYIYLHICTYKLHICANIHIHVV